MESHALLEKVIFSIDLQKYISFCEKFNQEVKDTNNLSFFKIKEKNDSINNICNSVFEKEIDGIAQLMSDPFSGISALDIPESPIFDKKTNSVCGIAIVMGIFNRIGKPNIDSLNQMPFSIFSASHENTKLLNSKEMTHYPPEVKLGFHNDGLLNESKINIPHHIMVYNMYINYRQPGNFKWVPIACWDEADKFERLLKGKLATIRITPNFYFDKAGEIKSTLVDKLNAPICRINDNGETLYFLNGNVLPSDNSIEIVEAIQSMRDSISNNSVKISIPQKERRAFFLRNDFGFHARDIFENPIEDADLTRVFIRAVDLNAKVYF